MNMAVFDLETNGTAGSSVLSASSIIFNSEGTVLDFFNRFYLSQERPSFCAIRVHGLTPGRLTALRQDDLASAYFLEDWPSLLDFWEKRDIAGVVVHNLAFDASFLPELAQGAFQWWCSMKGLTAFCALPKRPGNFRSGPNIYKWPKLSEAVDIVCNGPLALAPPEETERVERLVGEGCPHVSLYDCFELYRIVSRIARHRPDLLNFTKNLCPFRSPGRTTHRAAPPEPDFFTESIVAYEKKLRSAI